MTDDPVRATSSREGHALTRGARGALLAAALSAAALLASCAEDDAAPEARVVPDRSYQIERTYVVQQGDFLARIAEEQEVPVEELLALNDLTDPTEIEVGQAIILAVDTYTVRAARPRLVDSPAAADSAVLDDLGSWPVQLSLGQSAFAFVGAGAAVTAALLYALYAAVTLTVEAVAPLLPARRAGAVSERSGRPRRLPRVPGVSGIARIPRPRLRRRSGGSDGSGLGLRRRAAATAGALKRGAARGSRVAAVRAGRASRWTAPRVWDGVAAALLLAGRLTRVAARQLVPLGSNVKTASREANGRRRRMKLRAELEDTAEVPLRLGLLDGAEARFRATLDLCEREGWAFEEAMCLRGLAQIAEARDDRERALEMLDRAIELFEREGSPDYLLRARMRRQLLGQRDPVAPGG